MTPAVQTSVCVAIRSPPESATVPGPADASVVEVWISTPRLVSCFAAYSPRRVGISGRIFGAASTSTQRGRGRWNCG